jgi:hypothetical protein
MCQRSLTNNRNVPFSLPSLAGCETIPLGRGAEKMRIVLAITILAATLAPAVADQASVDRAIQIMQEEANATIAANKAKAAARDAKQKALCERVGSVRLGLNAEGVLKSCWGKPSKINTTITSANKHEQWVYGSGHYVYLTDGLVTSIQVSR